MRKFVILMFLAFVSAPLSAQPVTGEAGKLQIAGSQYEIIGVLLDTHNYSQILPEYRRILNLQLAPENEQPLVKATAVIVERLRRAEQYGVANQIVDQTIATVKLPESKFSLFMMKGKTLKDEGRLQEAIEIYRKAQQFAPPEK